MRAWVRNGSLRLVDKPVPALRRPLDVRVRVILAGLCRTDLAVARGELSVKEPIVLGHELAGRVDEASSRTGFRPGDPVAVDPRLSSTDGAGLLGVDEDGGFAEYVIISSDRLLRIPDGMTWPRAAYLEPLAACLSVLRADLLPHHRIYLSGGGRIAELTRRALRDRGFERFVEDFADVSIETGGTRASLAKACAATRPGGLVILKSRPPQPVLIDLAFAVARELRFQAVGYGSFEEALTLLRSGAPFVDDLLGAIHPLEDFTQLLTADEQKKVFLSPYPEEARRCVGS